MAGIKSFQGEFRWLSNFTECEILFDGVVYPSTENAYQAAKTTDLDIRVQFQTCTSGQAKRKGKSLIIRDDWEEVKVPIMYQLQLEKYKIPKFRKLLLSTGDCLIEEGNNWHDTFWGVCNGVGQNQLGKILMKVRNDILIQGENRTKIIVAGGRDLIAHVEESEAERLLINAFIELGYSNTNQIFIIEGGALGADRVGRDFAIKYKVPYKTYDAEWENLSAKGAVIKTNNYGKRYNAKAGFDRNQKMADVADELILFWDGRSKGSKDMLKRMHDQVKTTHIIRWERKS